MTQTLRTLDQVLAELPDNNTRLISPEDVRDLTVSAFGAIYNFDPGVQDDAFNTGGNGFFDAGSKWWNESMRILWGCFGGAHNAAIWRQIYPPIIPPVTPTRTTFTASFATDYTSPQSGLYAMAGGTPLAGDIVLVLSSGGAHSTNQGPWVAASGAWTRPSWYDPGTVYPCSPIVLLITSPFSLPLTIDGVYAAGDAGSPVYPIAPNVTATAWQRAQIGRWQIDTDGVILVDSGTSSRQEIAYDKTMTLSLPHVPTSLLTGNFGPIHIAPGTSPGTPNTIWIDASGNLFVSNNSSANLTVLTTGTAVPLLVVDVDFSQIVVATLTTGYVRIVANAPFTYISAFAMHTTQTWGITTNTSSISVIFTAHTNTPPAGEQLLWSFGATTLNEWRFPPGGAPQWTYQSLTGGASEVSWDIYIKITESGGIANVNRGHAKFALQYFVGN